MFRNRENFVYRRSQEEEEEDRQREREDEEYYQNMRKYNENMQERESVFLKRAARKQEQKIALARMLNPRGPRGVTLKQEIEAAAGVGSPAEFTRYSVYRSGPEGRRRTNKNVAKAYGQLKGVFNNNKYPSKSATGPVPSGRVTRKAMQKINWTQTKLPENYTESPVELTGNALLPYTDPYLRYQLGLSKKNTLSKAKKNAGAAGAAGAAKKRRTRRSRR
jgi:hypothetical protein